MSCGQRKLCLAILKPRAGQLVHGPTGHTDKQGLLKERDLFQTDAATLKELLSNGKKGDRSISHDL